MRTDKLYTVENPTLLKQTVDMKIDNNILKGQIALVETYLHEYCEVSGIKESDLKNHLVVGANKKDFSVMVINSTDMRSVMFGVKLNIQPGNITYDVFGEYLDTKEMYPKTTKAIQNYERRGVQNGSSSVAS